MGQTSSITCGLPYLGSRAKQTKLSIGLRITLIVLGVIAIVVGALILFKVPGLNHFGTTAGWVTFSLGAFAALLGIGLKCVKKRQPLVVPRESQFVSEGLLEPFFALNKESHVWMDKEKRAIVFGECVGFGGAKRALKIGEDEVLMLPNGDKDFYVWERMVDEEVQISDRLMELGLMTVQSQRVELYLTPDSNQALPAYRCPSFNNLAKKGIYIIEGNNLKGSTWKGKSYFKANEARYSLDSWLPIVKPLIRDIHTLAKNDCLFDGDSLNIAIIENEQGYTARYFGFDFSSKAKVCERNFGPREEDVTNVVARFLLNALERVFWAQYDFDTGRPNMGLAKEYYTLIEEFQAQLPRILSRS